ncbi:cytochrome c-type biogenesis protein CcmH [Ferrovibrio sp.]|uniref:cytochrome c-type biogenesis protein n=1 Tax=Ferrovibrio sp. TaxID=1917215 RepID=UPI0025BFF3C0|nr:cytochrome c-type biogenesis protein CcmH [Ferrovibrio sp.]MBX3455997.1 cytochrome c-type biogenesis protein CcmH [Ferrovibrio sp.]
MLKRLALLILLLTPLPLVSVPLAAQHMEPTLSDPAAEARARTLSKELRCLVCQNQSIEESNASLARDLRRIVRERIAVGDSDRQVLDYLVSRYGEWVLLTPRFNASTLLLWIGPGLLMALGILAVLMVQRRQRRALAEAPPAAPLSEAERKRLADLMKNEG